MTSMSQPLASSPSSRRKSVLFHWASTISLGWGCRSRTKKTGPEGCCSRPSPRSTKVKFGARVLDGAFRAMCTRLAADNNPNLLLLNYDLKSFGVTNLFVVPKQFFVPEVIEERKPLAATARRAGWVGCNILLNQIPKSGEVFFVRDRQPQPKEIVLAQWKKTLFLRDEGLEARGWLIEVMNCVDSIGKQEFQLDDVYAFESTLSQLYPNNRHVKQKIRQQLQVLRDRGYLDFVGRGYYRLRSQG